MFAGVMVWSLATMAGGIASNFSALFFSRSAVGAGEAVILPSAVKVIGDPTLITQPLAVPPTSLYVTAPPPDPPVVARLSFWLT